MAGVRDLQFDQPFTVVTEYDDQAVPQVFEGEDLGNGEYGWTAVDWSYSVTTIVLADGSVVSLEDV